MTIRVSHRLPALAKQRGAATLLVVLVLLIAMAMLAVTTMRSGMVEQQITGNDVRAREAQEAAEAGLEYGVAWAKKHKIPNTVTCSSGSLPTGCPPLTTIEYSPTGERENYTYTLTYTKGTDSIKVTSSSQGVADNSITATSEVWIKQLSILKPQGKSPPPLVIDGCMFSSNGTPDIFPVWNDINNDGIKTSNELGPSIMTSKPEKDPTGILCLFECVSPYDACDMNVHGGSLQYETPLPDNSIWNYYFDISQAQFKAAASTMLSTDGGLYWIESSSNWGGHTYGSASDPVAIVFVNDCPKPLGTTIIYGILFFLEKNGCYDDEMNGWGNVTVYGSVAANGKIKKLNSSPGIHGVGDDTTPTGPMEAINLNPIDAVRIPGTWKDF